MSTDLCDGFIPNPAGTPGANGNIGATGATGPTGAIGPASYTTLAAGFTMTATGVSVQIQVASTAWMAADLHTFIAAAGYFKIVSVDSASLVTVAPQAVSTNAADAASIPIGGVVIPAGVAFLDQSATNALAGRVTVLESADGGNHTYYSTSAPSGPGVIVGDLWFDTDDGYQLSRYDGSSWVTAQKVLDLADFGTGIRPVGIGTSYPGSPTEGDFFYRTDLDKLFRYSSSAWTAAVDGGELYGNVDGALVVDGTVVAAKIAAGAISATHIGTNEIIASSANIGDATITAAKIISLDAGKITTGDLTAVNLGYSGKIFHTSYIANKFHAIEMGTTFGNNYAFAVGTAFSFSSHPPLEAHCPGHGSWGAAGSIKICPDSDGIIRLQVQGRLIGNTGLISVYYRKNGTGSYIPIGARSSSDGTDSIIDATRQISGVSATDSFQFYVAPCNGNGDIATLITCRYELDITAFNW